jgi:acyl carrier protein
MNHVAVRERLVPVFHQIFDESPDELPDTITAKDIDGWDSLSHIDLIVAVEREFRVKFTAGEVTNLPNVGALIKLIEAKLAARPA